MAKKQSTFMLLVENLYAMLKKLIHVYPPNRQDISILIILLIVLLSLITHEKIKHNRDLYEINSFRHADTTDTIESLSRYINMFPYSRFSKRAEKRLVQLKTMPDDIYRLNMLSDIKISKNKQSSWEAYCKKYNFSLIYIPPGEFQMGQTNQEKNWLYNHIGKKVYERHYKDETPLCKIVLPGFWIGKTEVTTLQYVTFLNNTELSWDTNNQGNKYFDSRDINSDSHILFEKGKYVVEEGYREHPVTLVSWQGASEFCKWMSHDLGIQFCLPSEAQWEKAARWKTLSDGTGISLKYPWGNREPVKTNANFNRYYQGALPVGSFQGDISPYGVMDMAGNISEWCRHWYRNYNESALDIWESGDPPFGLFRVYRGGGWRDNAIELRCAKRGKHASDMRFNWLGFRFCTHFIPHESGKNK